MTVAKATFSIVVDVCDQAGEITRNLPSLLSQQYDGDYEVIVVDESSTDETSDILKQQKLKCPKLYTTFLPKYLYQKNKRSLALLIGRKASKKEWIVFTDIRTENLHETWLEELSKVTSPSTALILGYVNKKNGDLKLLTYETGKLHYCQSRTLARGYGTLQMDASPAAQDEIQFHSHAYCLCR